MTNIKIDADTVEKYIKLKRAVIGGVLVFMIIVSWHIYEYNIRDSDHKETVSEYEMHQITQKIFADEVRHNSYQLTMRLQGKTNASQRDDRAPQPLLEFNSEELDSLATSTITLMKHLYDNYELDNSIPEVVTPEEKHEELSFLEAILRTQVMKHTMEFLLQKGFPVSNHSAQLELLREIWFTLFASGLGSAGSSGFEHVFMAELRFQSIIGLQNWVFFAEQEQLGLVEYKGYIDRIDLGMHDQYLLAIRCTFHDIVSAYKPMFVGTSPEFEMSLYTICFLLSPDELCPVQLGKERFTIAAHALTTHNKKMLTMAYPYLK